MANYIMDQKGRLLATSLPTIRGDAAIGGPEVMEITVDLSQIGANTTLSQLGTQSSFPNSGSGFAAADTFDVAYLPFNAVVKSCQVLLDTTQTTPDVLMTGNGGTLTVGTLNVGDACVLASDRATGSSGSGGYSASATRYASAVSVIAAANSWAAATPILTARPAVVAPASDYFYTVRIALPTLTGATYTKSGKFRIRLEIVAFGNV